MKALEYIAHRINTIEALLELPDGVGAEIDLRSQSPGGKQIILAHDPWTKGVELSDWLNVFKKKPRGTLILNTKEDGLETQALQLLEFHQIEKFFFLDTTLPTLVKHALHGDHPKFAVRMSQYEPLASAQLFFGRLEWVWVDCFKGQPLSVEIVELAKKHAKICLVSPELHDLSVTDLTSFRRLAGLADAICTKRIDAWKSLLKEEGLYS